MTIVRAECFLICQLTHMKIFISTIFILFVFACTSREQRLCTELDGTPYTGQTVILYHQPISGSTYELFLFPVCGLELREPGRIWDSRGPGISLNLTSDDPMFRLLAEAAVKLPLKVNENLAENFKSIYVCRAQIRMKDYLISDRGEKSKKILKLNNDIATLHYRVAWKGSFAIDVVRPFISP